MEEDTQPCDTCGGTNFELIAGYYHCYECQVRRPCTGKLEFNQEDEILQGLLSNKTAIKRKTNVVEKVQLTTWECYNYVIKGLIEELLILGADVLLRSVVKKLWFSYLKKIEVIDLEKPKLQAVNTKTDAEIIYGKSRKKKRKRSYKATNAGQSSVGSVCSARELVKKKTRLFNSQLDFTLSKSVDNSVMDGTVGSLKSDSQKSGQYLEFNKYAKKELRKNFSKKHLKKHSKDIENKLSCHRNSYRETSKKYQNSPHLLSINKIYSILYLGLLLTKSKIQLADMIRFIREGVLTFNCFKRFFPEELSDNYLTKMFPRKSCFTSASLRESTFKMAKFLDVLDFMEVQNLALLIERYCNELNLPGIIEKRSLSSLLVSLPRMEIDEKSKLIPNYEARALSLILFQLKMIFSIDGKTEKYFSNTARTLNEENPELNLFDFMKWLQYIDYRKHTLAKHHFPTQFASNKQIKDSDAFIKFLSSRPCENEDYSNKKTKGISFDIKQLLMKLKGHQSNIDEEYYFQPSFTPSIDNLKVLLDTYCINEDHEKKILTRNFKECNLDYLLEPSEYVELYKKDRIFEIKLNCANENIKKLRLINLDTERHRKLREDRNFEVIRLGVSSKNKLDDQKVASTSAKVGDVPDGYLEKFQLNYGLLERTKEIENQLRLPDSPELDKTKCTLFVPHESYWVNTHCNLGILNKEIFEEYLNTYPYNFQFILKEMARIVEQNEQEVLEEFSLTEIYLLYGEKYQTHRNDNINIIENDGLMKKIVEKAMNHW